jgi:hypothetical protein
MIRGAFRQRMELPPASRHLPAAGGDGSKGRRPLRADLECDHPSLFPVAWTDTRGSASDDKQRNGKR